MSTMGDYREYCGDTQYFGDIMMIVADVMSTMGNIILCNLSIVGDIMTHVGDIMSTVGVFSPMVYSNNKRFFPHGT